MFDYYTTLIGACAAQIDQQVTAMKPRFEPVDNGPPLKARYPSGVAELEEQKQAHLQRAGGVEAGRWA